MEDEAEDRALRRWAEAIADGAKIDWQAEAVAAPHLRTLITHLQSVERVIQAHHRVSEEWTAVHSEPQSVAPAGPGAPGPERVGGTPRWGQLELRELLASGSFGEVFRAYDPALQREVALKLLHGEASSDSAHYLAEARRLARIRHPNVLVVHGAGFHDGRVGLWADLVEGRPIEELLSTQGTMGATEAAIVGMEVCRALAAVHAAGIIHRDVKTTNIMRESGGRIVLTDFGSSEASDLASGEPLSEGASPMTMAPEQIAGERVGPAADLYALGVVLYRLVTGKYPFPGETLAEVCARKTRGEHVALNDARPDLPPAFVRVVERALERDPARRFPTAGAMEHALAVSIGAGASGSGPTPATWSMPAWLLVALLASLGMTVLWFWLARRVPQGESVSPPSRANASMVSGRAVRAPGSAEGGGAGSKSRPPLTANVQLYRPHSGHDQILHSGDRIAPRDALYLRIESPDSTYVYVLDEDETGRSYVLFPVPGVDQANPLAPGTEHRLPGRLRGRLFNWQVTSAGGAETIAVLASRRPLSEFESEIAALPAAQPGGAVSYAPVSHRMTETLRSIAGMSEEPSDVPAAGQRMSEILRRLTLKKVGPDAPMTWEIVLENPRPAVAR